MNARLKSFGWCAFSGVTAALAWTIPVHGSFCARMACCGGLALTGVVSTLIGTGTISESLTSGRSKAIGLAVLMILGSVCATAPLVRWMGHRYFCLQLQATNNQILRAECSHLRECHSRLNVPATVHTEKRNGR